MAPRRKRKGAPGGSAPSQNGPEALIGRYVALPGYWWNGCAREDRNRLFRCRLVRYDAATDRWFLEHDEEEFAIAYTGLQRYIEGRELQDRNGRGDTATGGSEEDSDSELEGGMPSDGEPDEDPDEDPDR